MGLRVSVRSGCASAGWRAVVRPVLRSAFAIGVLAAMLAPVGAQNQPASDAPRALGYPAPITNSPDANRPHPGDTPPGAPPEQAEPVPPNMQIFEGTGEFTRPRTGNSVHDTQAPGDITLDFSDVDVHDVVRSVLGEILKVPYVIDPGVSGHVTLKTGAPIGQSAVLPALETALKANGSAIVLSNGIYNIVPVADAAKRGGEVSANAGGVAGYGTEIVSLSFVSADEIQKILEPLIPPGGGLRIDRKRNLVFLSGTEPERAAMRDTIALFDVNYLRGMSFAMIQPSHVDAGTLAVELDKIFDETSSPIAGLVRIIPITRINTLLIASSRPTYLREVGRWVTRLDVVPTAPGRQLHYYKLQNVRAGEIAQTLGRLFGSSDTPGGQNGAAPPTDNATPQRDAPPAQSDAPEARAPTPNAAGTPARGGTSVGGGDNPQIVTDDGNNALIIRADAAEYDAIEKIIRQMDVAPDQVMIETTIVEVTLNDQLKYGVEWYFKNGSQTFVQGTSLSPAVHLPGFGYTLSIPNVEVALSALGTLTNITVLSSPKLLTLDNKPATIEVGDQVPIVTQTSVSANAPNAPVISSVDQRDTGVILSVTPRIGNSGMVFLEVSQEVSDVIPTTSSGIDSPTIQQRRLRSTVAIADGNTVALGGFIRRSDSGGNSGIPYLKDVPVIGTFFGSHNNTRERTELIIFLTPRVVRSPPVAAAITDDLRKELDDLRAAVERFDAKKDDIPRRPW